MAAKQDLRIDIVSDVICPFCYIGKRKLEEAMRQTSDKYNFIIRWEPFLLRPNTPEEGTPLPKAAGKIILPPHIVTAGRDVGISFTGVADVIPNTVIAHTLLEYAKGLGDDRSEIQNELQERIFQALFTRGVLPTLKNVIDIAKDVGIDPEAARKFVEDRDNQDRTRRTARYWAGTGITGVPTFYMNGRLAFSGAQDVPVFVDTFNWVATKFPDGRLTKPKL